MINVLKSNRVGPAEKGKPEKKKQTWQKRDHSLNTSDSAFFSVPLWLDGCESQWTPGSWWWTGRRVVRDSWGRKESDTTEQLIWSDLWQGNWKGVKPCIVFWVVHFRLWWSLPQCRYSHSQQTRSSPWASPEVKGQSVSERGLCTGWNQVASSKKEFFWAKVNMNWLCFNHSNTHTQPPTACSWEEI